MRVPLPNAYNATVYGSMAVLGTGAYLGLKHGPEGEGPAERAKAGMMYSAFGAGVAGAAGFGIYKYGPKRLGKQAWQGVRNYGSRIGGNYARSAQTDYLNRLRRLRAAGEPVTEAAMSKARFLSRASSVSKLATVPVMAGAGAVLGAMIAGEDHRTRGAVIGAGVGTAASLAIHGAQAWKSIGKAGKFGMAIAVASLAFGAGQSGHQEPAAVAVPNETGGTEYLDPGEAASHGTGAGRRSRNMNASGDMVFGMSRGRHG